MKATVILAVSIAVCLVSACEKKDGESANPTVEKTEEGAAQSAAEAKPAEANKPTSPAVKAKIGQPAPDFTLKGLDGTAWTLSDHIGKVVVLEWFNPECPYVKIAHNEGTLKTGAADLMKTGVVYVAINSGAKGRQGHGADINTKGKKDFGMTHPVLLDPEGAVGRTYRATRTPHMMVVDQKGYLAYRGALDNSGGGDLSDAPGGLRNYVTSAVSELMAGKPVTESETRPWGCGVKYAQ